VFKFQSSPKVATAKGEGEGKEQGLQGLFNAIQEHFYLLDRKSHTQSTREQEQSDIQVGISLVCPSQHIT